MARLAGRPPRSESTRGPDLGGRARGLPRRRRPAVRWARPVGSTFRLEFHPMTWGGGGATPYGRAGSNLAQQKSNLRLVGRQAAAS